MLFIKTLLAGLVGVLLCIANISGIVTDTGMTPLAGAVVKLEKGGHTATTGSDGSFTLVVNTAILPFNGTSLLTNLFKGISGNTLNLRIAERDDIKVASLTSAVNCFRHYTRLWRGELIPYRYLIMEAVFICIR